MIFRLGRVKAGKIEDTGISRIEMYAGKGASFGGPEGAVLVTCKCGVG